jgi:hypothetical protein
VAGAGEDAVYFEALEDIELLHCVADGMGLARETGVEFRGLRRGQAIGVPRHSGTLRVKAAAWVSGKMKEQLVDAVVLRPVGIEIRRTPGKETALVKARNPRGPVYLSAAWLTASELSGRSTVRAFEGSEFEMPLDPAGCGSTVLFAADLKDLACCSESFRHAAAEREPDPLQVPAPRAREIFISLPDAEGAQGRDAAGIFGALFETFRLRAEDSALNLSFFIGLNFRLFFLNRDNRHLEFSRLGLNRLYSMLLLDPYILPEEKLAVFFNLRLLWINRERHGAAEMTAIASFLLPKAVRKSREETGVAFLLRDLTGLLYAGMDDPPAKNRAIRALKKEVLRSGKLPETAGALLLLAHQDAAFVRKFLPRLFPGGIVAIPPAEITTSLFPLLDALDFSRIPYGLSDSR